MQYITIKFKEATRHHIALALLLTLTAVLAMISPFVSVSVSSLGTLYARKEKLIRSLVGVCQLFTSISIELNRCRSIRSMDYLYF